MDGLGTDTASNALHTLPPPASRRRPRSCASCYLTLRPVTERPVTVTNGSNRLVTPAELPSAVSEALAMGPYAGELPPLWDGVAGPHCPHHHRGVASQAEPESTRKSFPAWKLDTHLTRYLNRSLLSIMRAWSRMDFEVRIFTGKSVSLPQTHAASLSPSKSITYSRNSTRPDFCRWSQIASAVAP
jgi:hypothetical protein